MLENRPSRLSSVRCPCARLALTGLFGRSGPQGPCTQQPSTWPITNLNDLVLPMVQSVFVLQSHPEDAKFKLIIDSLQIFCTLVWPVLLGEV
jgi:hypothetical protein